MNDRRVTVSLLSDVEATNGKTYKRGTHLTDTVGNLAAIGIDGTNSRVLEKHPHTEPDRAASRGPSRTTRPAKPDSTRTATGPAASGNDKG